MPGKYTNVRPQMDEQKLEELAAAMKADGRDQLCVRKVKLGVKSLAFLEHFGHLRALFIEEVKAGLDALKFLENLENLDLIQMRQLKCAALRGVPHLRELYIGFSSVSSFEGIEALSGLEDLSLRSVSGLAGLEFVSQFTKLKELSIIDCKGTTSVPNLANLDDLTEIRLSGLRDLQNIDGVFAAPRLKRLSLGALPNIEPEDLKPALEHPTLELIYPALVGIEGAAKDIRAAELLKSRFGDVFDLDRWNA